MLLGEGGYATITLSINFSNGLLTVLTQARLKELLHYCPETGVFVWKVGRLAGLEAGHVRHHGSCKDYRYMKVRGTNGFAHRFAFLYMTGSFPVHEVDHINGNSLDNSWCNLRDVPRTVNCRNARMRKDNTSGVTGVYWCKTHKRWVASVSGKTVGSSQDKTTASAIRAKYLSKYGYSERHGI